MQTFNRAFEESVTGCTISSEKFKLSPGKSAKMQIILTAERGQLSVQYLSEKKELVSCIEQRPFSLLSYPGYFGVSARNTEKRENAMDMHVKSARLTNFDPTKYSRTSDLFTADELNKANSDIILLRESLGFTDEQFLEELTGGDINQVFTDELKGDAFDLLKKYAH